MSVKVSLSVSDACVLGNMTAELLFKLDGLYASYHKQWWCRRQMFYHFKIRNALCNGLALLVMAISIVVGAVWEQSFAVVGLTALATFIKGWSDFKKYSFKMDMCRFAYTTYEKTLMEIKGFVRSGVDDFQFNNFLVKMQTLNETITDFTPTTSDTCPQKLLNLLILLFNFICLVVMARKRGKVQNEGERTLT